MHIHWIQIASLSMFIAVALGAFGAHGLKDKLSEYALDIYQTGVLYQFIHGVALFIVAWLATLSNNPKIFYAGICFLLGTLFFSGSLYAIAVTGIRPLGMITPIGGILFLIGWALLFFTKIN